MIHFILKCVGDLFAVMSTSIIYKDNNFEFTILSLFLTFLAINLLFDLLMLFLAPKVDHKRDFVKNVKTYHKNNYSKDAISKKHYLK